MELNFHPTFCFLPAKRRDNADIRVLLPALSQACDRPLWPHRPFVRPHYLSHSPSPPPPPPHSTLFYNKLCRTL